MRRLIEVSVLMLILLLAAYLRLSYVSNNPGWYTDETTHIDIARHLLHGETRYLAIQQSTLLFARLPLFEYALAAVFKLFGVGDAITTLRTFTGLLGVLSVGILYGIVRWMRGGGILALMAAFMLAIYPQAVLYSRFGFSYSLLPPLILLALAGLWSYLEHGSLAGLALASILIGLGMISEVMMLTLIPVVILTVIWRSKWTAWRDLVWSLPLLALPFTLYAALTLLTVPNAFWFDLHFTLTRVGGLSLPAQVQNLALNYATLISQDSWIFAGVMGLWLLRPVRLRGLCLLAFAVPVILMGRNVALYSLSAYYLIPLLPLIALGAASFVFQAVHYLQNLMPVDLAISVRRGLAAGIVLIVVVSPLLVSTGSMLQSIQTYWQTAIDPFVVVPQDARAAADYLRQQLALDQDEMVIASPVFGWQVSDTVNVADFQMSVAYAGADTPHLPGNIPPERWAFDPRLEQASFVVVDNLWTNWGAVHIPGVAVMLHEVEMSWKLVYQSGAIRVYRRSSPTQ